MRLRHISALIANDARLHGRGILFTQAGMVALVWLATCLPRSEEALVSLVFSQNFLLALLWGDWLISREKLKGTFGWVRTLPVSDRDLVAAKFLSITACCVSLWVITTVPFLGAYFAGGRMATWTVLLLWIVAFGGLSIAVRWRFTQKLGMIVPLLIVFLPLMVIITARRASPETVRVLYGFWDDPVGMAVVAIVLGSLLMLVFLWTVWWVRRSDTFRLLE